MKLEKELVDLIREFRLREIGIKSLKRILEELSRTEKKLDGYSVENLSYKYNRHEIRLLNESQGNCILARFDIFIDDGISNRRIGYFDYVVNFKGEFIDEFLVFE